VMNTAYPFTSAWEDFVFGSSCIFVTLPFHCYVDWMIGDKGTTPIGSSSSCCLCAFSNVEKFNVFYITVIFVLAFLCFN